MSNTRRPTITQAQLATLQRLQTVIAEHNRLRKQLLEQLERGASIELGRLTAEISIVEQQRFSFERVAEVVGASQAKLIRDQLKLTTVRKLQIFGTPGVGPNQSRYGRRWLQ